MPDEERQRDFAPPPPPPSAAPPGQIQQQQSQQKQKQTQQQQTQQQNLPEEEVAPENLPLIDELGIVDIEEPLAGGRGRLFSAAGRHSPLAEFTKDFVIMHPPQLPFSDDGPAEDICTNVDSRGVLLDEFGDAKHIAGAKFKGMQLWCLGEQLPGTSKYLVAWFDGQNKAHRLFVNEEPLTIDVVFRLRNKTHDGELSFFADVTTD